MGIPSIDKDHGRIYKPDTCKPLVDAVEAGKVKLHALARGSYPGKKMRPQELPGLKSVGYWDTTGNQTWGLDWHRNEGLELTFLETGLMPFEIQNRQYTLQPGDLTFTRPWQPHKVGAPNIQAGRLYWVILDVEVRRPNQNWKWPKWIVTQRNELDELSNILRQNEEPVWASTTGIRQCFKRIGQAVETNERNSALSKTAVYLNELILLVIEMLRQQELKLNPDFSGTYRTLELFFEDLQNHQERLIQPWTVEQMAEQCGMGVTAFINHCKILTNLTPGKYLNQLRIDLTSKVLIESPSQSITDVAFSCGFSSSQYFATSFKKLHGCTPKEFRQKKR